MPWDAQGGHKPFAQPMGTAARCCSKPTPASVEDILRCNHSARRQRVRRKAADACAGPWTRCTRPGWKRTAGEAHDRAGASGPLHHQGCLLRAATARDVRHAEHPRGPSKQERTASARSNTHALAVRREGHAASGDLAPSHGHRPEIRHRLDLDRLAPGLRRPSKRSEPPAPASPPWRRPRGPAFGDRSGLPRTARHGTEGCAPAHGSP
jgi:hypothetical protein